MTSCVFDRNILVLRNARGNGNAAAVFTRNEREAWTAEEDVRLPRTRLLKSVPEEGKSWRWRTERSQQEKWAWQGVRGEPGCVFQMLSWKIASISMNHNNRLMSLLCCHLLCTLLPFHVLKYRHNSLSPLICGGAHSGLFGDLKRKKGSQHLALLLCVSAEINVCGGEGRQRQQYLTHQSDG